MGLGPIEASRQALARAGMTIDDIDLVEINEAFAAQVIPSAKHLGIDWEKLNVHGGGIALGHPFGMTGARIMTTLIHGLRDRGQDVRPGDDVRRRRPGHGHDRRTPELTPFTSGFWSQRRPESGRKAVSRRSGRWGGSACPGPPARRRGCVQPTVRLTANVGVNSATRQPGRRHHDAGEELDVARQRPVRLERGPASSRMRRSTSTAWSTRSPPSADGDLAQQHRAWVAGAVDGVAEAHDPPAGGELGLDPRLGPVRVADGVERVERPARRAAVQRPGQRAEARRRRRRRGRRRSRPRPGP